ncbi:MAG: hypothetical protein KME16_18660 [Scytolyngbya sp. HA4215-MV1]|jgi:hypothetical protein|nr:hypothetical protein [Scytolyngbya sp. HA4215-MV1]
MMVVILIIVVALVAWSLHLMQEAMQQREFSLMLAGTLVAMAAAAMMGVYFLMGNYIGYASQSAQYVLYREEPWEPSAFIVLSEDIESSWAIPDELGYSWKVPESINHLAK